MDAHSLLMPMTRVEATGDLRHNVVSLLVIALIAATLPLVVSGWLASLAIAFAVTAGPWQISFVTDLAGVAVASPVPRWAHCYRSSAAGAR